MLLNILKYVLAFTYLLVIISVGNYVGPCVIAIFYNDDNFWWACCTCLAALYVPIILYSP